MNCSRTLSVLVPIYNERATIERLLTQVVSVKTGLTLEVLACDDGSTDGTREILSKLSLPGLNVIFMDQNVGRGGVIKHLWTLATGDIYVHQDADLEYNPQDYIPLLQPILNGSADVVYGSRFKGSIEKMRWLNRMGNHVMTADGTGALRRAGLGSDDVLQDVSVEPGARADDSGQRLRLRGRVHGAAGAARRAVRRSAGRASPGARSRKARRSAPSTRCA